MKTSEIAKLLETEHLSKYNGQFKYWRSYFYSHGMTPENLMSYVKSKIPNAVMIDSGDHFHDFVGGTKSGSSQDSYMWVTFTIPEKSIGEQPAFFSKASKKWLKQPITASDLIGI
jgi:hypothetical protein